MNGQKISVNSTNISIDGKHVNQSRFFEGKANSLLLAGFYSNKVSNATDGIFFCTIDKDGQQTDLKSVEIPNDVIKQFTSEKTKKKNAKTEEDKDASIDNMLLRQIIIGEDNSFLFVGEKYYYLVSQDKNGVERYSYYYEEMLVAKIASDGSLIFIKKLPKRQLAVSPNPPSKFNALGMRMLTKVFDGESLGFRLIESSEYYYEDVSPLPSYLFQFFYILLKS